MTEETIISITEEGLNALDNAEVVPDGPGADACTCDGQAATCEGAFTPDTPERADWVLGKIADAKARAARIRAHAEAMAKQAEAEATFFEWKYGAALQEFARRELAGGRRKSLTLYHGVIGFRTRPAAFQFDEAAALAWCSKNQPEALAYKVDRKALGEALRVTEAGLVIAQATGEVVTFAAYAPAEEQFFIK